MLVRADASASEVYCATRFSPVSRNIRISARETAQMVLQRIILEEARGYCINWICDRDQRFLGEACAQMYEMAGVNIMDGCCCLLADC